MNNLKILSAIAVKASAVVHETQKERGASALFIGSGGKEFGSELSSQRADTDKKITDLQAFLKGFDNNKFGVEFKSSMDRGLNNLDMIRGKRDSASALSVSAVEIIDYYTNTNASLLDIIANISKLSANAEVSTMAFAYINFLQAKERAGMERAILSNAFAAGRFNPGIFKKFGAIVAAQDAYINVFVSSASASEIDFYKNKMQGQFVDETAKMRKSAFDKANEKSLGEDPEHWFKMQTGKINLLKEVEDKLSDGLNLKAAQLKGKARSALMFFIAISAIAGAASLFLAYIVMRSITRPLNNMSDFAQKIASGDLNVNIEVKSKDEVGILGNAFKNMIVYLKDMARSADAIAQGDLLIDVSPKSEKDVLGNAFREMTVYLKAMAKTTEDISEGDLRNEITPEV